MNETIKKIQKLRNQLKKWSKEYYNNNNNIVSNAKYDKTYNLLVKLETKNPNLITKNSITQKIGNKSNNKFKKVLHKYKMFSIDNAFDNDDLINFDKHIKIKLNSFVDIKYATEFKIDGLSISIIYKNGKLMQAITRGDGLIYHFYK